METNKDIEIVEINNNLEENITQTIEKSFDKIVDEILVLEDILKEKTNLEDKVETIYKLGIDFLSVCFSNINKKKLPIQALKVFSTLFIDLIEENKLTLSAFNKFIPNVYHVSNHAVNVAIFSCLIGAKAGLGSEELHKLFLAGLLHDVGQHKIDKLIINKKGKLTKNEIKILQNHPYESIQYLIQNSVSDQDILSSIRYHHERLDGSGYPEGLKEYSISTGGQILAISDVFEALITKKSYRDAFSTFDALIEMKKNMSKQFNLKYIDIFIKLLR